MYQIVIVPTDSKANAALFFKSKDSAEAAHKNIFDAQRGVFATQILKVQDDYGVTLTIDRDKICCVMIMDSEKQMELAAVMGGTPNVKTH